MPDPVPIPDLPAAGSLTGAEDVPIDQGGTTKRTTSQAIADLAPPGAFANLTDVDQSTAGGGKYLTKQTSSGKPYSFQTAGGGSSWTPVTWTAAGGTNLGNNVWEVTPPGVGSTQEALSDISLALAVGDTLEIVGVIKQNVNGPFVCCFAHGSPAGEALLAIGTSGGGAYFNDGGGSVTSNTPAGLSAGEVFAPTYTPFRVRGTVIQTTSGSVVIAWDCEMGGQLLGGSDSNGSTYTGAFKVDIGMYQSTGGSAVQQTFYGLQYQVIPG